MPTTDLVANYGGVGDGQRTSVTGSITSGASPVFTPSTNIFAAGGDPTGRAIYLKASGFSYPTGATAITITAYNAGTGAVTLSGTNSTVQSSVTMDVLWGTDNTNAFVGASGSYRAWAQGLGSTQAHLTIPAGHYLANLDPFRPLNKGVKNAFITGPSGAPTTCKISNINPSEMRLGGDVSIPQNLGLTNASGFTARLNSTTAGSSTATLVDKTGYGSRITVGADCFLTGYDTESVGAGTFGYPPNPYFYEVNKITNYDSVTGTITFQNPLRYAYMSDWPNWSTSSINTDQGGPATVYVLVDYDRVVEIQDVTLDSPYDQIACHGRSVILRNVRHTGWGVYPTMNQTYEAYDTTYPFNHELDKICGTVLFQDCTAASLQVQSASPDVLTITRGSVAHITGTPKSLVVDGTAMTGAVVNGERQIQIGMGYGRTNSVSLSNVTNLDVLTASPSANTGIHAGGFSATMPMANGIFTFLRSENDGVVQENPGLNLVPGTWISLDHKMYIQITRVWSDSTYVYHQTNLSGGWPFTVGTVRAHPCPDFTMRSCAGAAPELEDWNQAPARIPLYSYSKRAYTADGTGTTVKAKPSVIGRLVTAKLNVTTPGSVGFHESQFDNWTTYKSDYSSYTFPPVIDCTNGGLRTVNGGSTASGAQGSDSIPNLTSIGQIWFSGVSNSGPVFSANGSNAVLTVEFTMDQGIPPAVPTAVAPLWLRLHA